jgi:glycosyltransferase involved in cell wall biosynthesis
MISVIIPCYNNEGTLDAALASVQAQTLSGWKAVIVNDGSSDRTLEIAVKWAQNDPRMRVVTKENGGASAARNLGLQSSESEWVCFLDADDLYPRAFLEQMLAAARKSPSLQPHYCGMRIIGENGEVVHGASLASREVAFEDLAHVCPFPIHSVILPRKVLGEAGVFDPRLLGREDWDLWSRIARCGYKFQPVPELMVDYRMRASSKGRNFLRGWRYGLEVLQRTHRQDGLCRRPAASYRNGCECDNLEESRRQWTLKMIARSAAHGCSEGVAEILDYAGPTLSLPEPESLGMMLCSELGMCPNGFREISLNWPRIAESALRLIQRAQGEREWRSYYSESLFWMANGLRRRCGLRPAMRVFASSLISSPWSCTVAASRCAERFVRRMLPGRRRHPASR